MDSSHAFENFTEELGTVPRVGGKQTSKRVRMSAAKVQHRNTNTCSWGGGLTCHIKFSQQSRRWGMSPHSNLLHTQQVLTSGLRLACCESNSSGRHRLIRMHTDSLYPIPVFERSQVLPLICCPANQGVIGRLLQGRGKLGSTLGVLFFCPTWLTPSSFIFPWLLHSLHLKSNSQCLHPNL